MFLVYPENSCETTVFFPRFLEKLIGKTSWFHCGEAFNFRCNFFHANKIFSYCMSSWVYFSKTFPPLLGIYWDEQTLQLVSELWFIISFLSARCVVSPFKNPRCWWFVLCLFFLISLSRGLSVLSFLSKCQLLAFFLKKLHICFLFPCFLLFFFFPSALCFIRYGVFSGFLGGRLNWFLAFLLFQCTCLRL